MLRDARKWRGSNLYTLKSSNPKFPYIPSCNKVVSNTSVTNRGGPALATKLSMSGACRFLASILQDVIRTPRVVGENKVSVAIRSLNQVNEAATEVRAILSIQLIGWRCNYLYEVIDGEDHNDRPSNKKLHDSWIEYQQRKRIQREYRHCFIEVSSVCCSTIKHLSDA